MTLKELAHQLADLAWALEERTQHPASDTVLEYVRDAVTVEVEYRRRLRDLERRLNEILAAPAGVRVTP